LKILSLLHNSCCRPDFHEIVSILDSMRMRQPGSVRPLVISTLDHLVSAAALQGSDAIDYPNKLGWSVSKAGASGSSDPLRQKELKSSTSELGPKMASSPYITVSSADGDDNEDKGAPIILSSAASIRVSYE
jgi:hypothetical protein